VPLGSGVKYTSDLGTPWPEPLLERYELVSQGIAAERVADKWAVDRTELDEIALTSHRRAASAAAEGRFARETVPLVGVEGLVEADQGIRPDTTLERLAALPAVFEEGGKITAGNASQISDGAAAILLMSAERAIELGVEGRGRIVDHVMTGSDPVLMLTGPMSATASLLARNGMTISNIDLAEVNEAFASVIAAWLRETSADPARVNVNGGAIALGHPLGASGARLITTLLHELERRDEEVGLVTMCCAGGLGTGTLIGRHVN
jgi:acetyl-CoA acetyltransferase family protein